MHHYNIYLCVVIHLHINPLFIINTENKATEQTREICKSAWILQTYTCLVLKGWVTCAWYGFEGVTSTSLIWIPLKMEFFALLKRNRNSNIGTDLKTKHYPSKQNTRLSMRQCGICARKRHGCSSVSENNQRQKYITGNILLWYIKRWLLIKCYSVLYPLK